MYMHVHVHMYIICTYITTAILVMLQKSDSLWIQVLFHLLFTNYCTLPMVQQCTQTPHYKHSFQDYTLHDDPSLILRDFFFQCQINSDRDDNYCHYINCAYVKCFLFFLIGCCLFYHFFSIAKHQ